MNMRVGFVVATHPEDYSVDLVMVDDGARLIGVQVATMNGSTRTGTVDLPAVPPRANKWDISQPTGQDMKALVAYVGRQPVVVGFLYPQINQMLSADPKLRYDRHQSDVVSSIDGDGNVQIVHPSGTYVRIGETADLDDMAGKNADANSAVDRNNGRQVYVRIGMAAGMAVVTIAPDGDITITSQAGFSLTAVGPVSLESGTSIRLTAPRIDINE